MTSERNSNVAFVLDVTVEASVIDHYGHVNNAEYVRWLERASWAHSTALGLDLEDYRRLDRAMVVHRHEIDYLAPACLGDALRLTTRILECEGRLTLTRGFELQRPRDERTLLRARTRYACIELSSGRARRMPPAFARIYGEAADPDIRF